MASPQKAWWRNREKSSIPVETADGIKANMNSVC